MIPDGPDEAEDGAEAEALAEAEDEDEEEQEQQGALAKKKRFKFPQKHGGRADRAMLTQMSAEQDWENGAGDPLLAPPKCVTLAWKAFRLALSPDDFDAKPVPGVPALQARIVALLEQAKLDHNAARGAGQSGTGNKDARSEWQVLALTLYDARVSAAGAKAGTKESDVRAAKGKQNARNVGEDAALRRAGESVKASKRMRTAAAERRAARPPLFEDDGEPGDKEDPVAPAPKSNGKGGVSDIIRLAERMVDDSEGHGIHSSDFRRDSRQCAFVRMTAVTYILATGWRPSCWPFVKRKKGHKDSTLPKPHSTAMRTRDITRLRIRRAGCMTPWMRLYVA